MRHLQLMKRCAVNTCKPRYSPSPRLVAHPSPPSVTDALRHRPHPPTTGEQLSSAANSPCLLSIAPTFHFLPSPFASPPETPRTQRASPRAITNLSEQFVLPSPPSPNQPRPPPLHAPTKTTEPSSPFLEPPFAGTSSARAAFFSDD